MKRSWLIGAALVFSLTAVGCKDDDEDEEIPKVDAGPDSGVKTDAGSGMDGGSIDSGLKDGGTTDGGADGGDAG